MGGDWTGTSLYKAMIAKPEFLIFSVFCATHSVVIVIVQTSYQKWQYTAYLLIQFLSMHISFRLKIPVITSIKLIFQWYPANLMA
jgi:hypothetical protein